MIDEVCLEIQSDSRCKYICNRAYIDKYKKEKQFEIGVGYEVIDNKLVRCMEDLIKYCLTYNIDINVPNNYKVTEIYNIIFSTGNFEPDDREYSTCSSSIVYSSTNKKYIEDKFRFMCKITGKKNHNNLYKHYFCWHTEDFAHNQIIHSYNIDKSYLVEKVGVE